MLITKCYIYVLLLLIFFPDHVLATQKQQEETDPKILLAKELLTNAYKMGKNSSDSSEFYFNQAKNAFITKKKWGLYSDACFQQCRILNYHGLYDSMASVIKTCLPILEKNLTNNLSTIVKQYRMLGVSFYNKKDFDNAIKYYQKGLSYYPIIGEDKEFSYLYTNLSFIYSAKFDLDNALDYLEKGYQLKLKLGLKGRTIAVYFTTKGQIHFEKREYSKAIESFKNALEIYSDINNINGKLNCLFYLGEAFRVSKDYNKALNWFNKGLNEGRKATPTRFINTYMFRLNVCKAKTYSELEENKLAEKYFMEAWDIVENKNNSWFNYHYGDHLQKMNLLDSALTRYQTGIINILYDFKETDVYKNPEIYNSKSDARLLQLLLSKAKTFYKKYQLAPDQNIKELNLAFETNLLAEELINKILNSYKSAGSKLAWSQFMSNAYEQSITTSLALFKETKEEKYLTTAFNISEQSKASTLINGIRTSEAKKFAGIPDDVLQKEKELKINLSYKQSQLIREQYQKKEKDSSNIFNLKEKIFALNREQEDLTLQLEKQYPKYYEFKYANETINIQELQNTLNENTTLVEYFIGDSSIYAFTVNQNGLKVIQLENMDSLSEKVIDIQEALRKSDFPSYAVLSYNFYQKLIAPLQLKNEQLIIIPDGPLWYLNFDILLSQKPSKKDFKSCRYLIKDYNINYAYSAGLLIKGFQNNKTSDNNDCLAFSYNNEDEKEIGDYIAMRGFRNSKRDLPGTRKEISAISNVINGAYYFGAFANEKNFKEKAKNYGILHLALHGEINDEQPMNSRLLFTQDNDSLEDNYLHAYELYNTELNAELAVLSACNTGSGKLVKGEGVMSMGRAFTYAGVKSLVLSQWELSDEFTPNLMENFYKNLKEGQTKSEALRNAKLYYLENADNLSANPYYWAPLVQLGDNSPLPKKSIWVWLAMGFVIISVVLSTYKIITRK